MKSYRIKMYDAIRILKKEARSLPCLMFTNEDTDNALAVNKESIWMVLIVTP